MFLLKPTHGGTMSDNDEEQTDQLSDNDEEQTAPAPLRREEWTAQSSGGLPDDEPSANQMFTPEQLPDPNVARAAGIAPVRIPTNLILDGADAYDHPLGPEPGERERLEHRDAIKARLEQPAQAEPGDESEPDTEPDAEGGS